MRICVESKFSLGEKVYFLSEQDEIFYGTIRNVQVSVVMCSEYFRYNIRFMDNKNIISYIDVIEHRISFKKEELELRTSAMQATASAAGMAALMEGDKQ